MVLKTSLCRFSGLRIYPGKGTTFVRGDGQNFLLMGSKCRSLFHQRVRAAKINWTAMYRKQHKKDQTTDSSRRKRRTHQKVTLRSIVGASLEVIQKKRNEKPEVRQAARDAALREVKERMRKSKDAKKATGGKTQAGGKVEKAARSRGGKQGGKTGAGGLR